MAADSSLCERPSPVIGPRVERPVVELFESVRKVVADRLDAAQRRQTRRLLAALHEARQGSVSRWQIDEISKALDELCASARSFIDLGGGRDGDVPALDAMLTLRQIGAQFREDSRALVEGRIEPAAFMAGADLEVAASARALSASRRGSRDEGDLVVADAPRPSVLERGK